jgi:cysteine desulfurase/selenocysteine lyase
MMAHTGVGGLILKRDYVKELKPLALWWWTINDVSVDDYVLRKWRWKYEAGTPNIIWAVSLEYALEYIKSLWEGDIRKGMGVIGKHEQELAEYWIEKFKELKDKVRLIGPEKNRIPLFSFIIHWHENINQVGEYFADKWICIRCGWHCAYPLHKNFQIGGTCRMSTYIYNEKEDLDRFFDVLNELINS